MSQINGVEVTPHPIRHPEYSEGSQNASLCHIVEDSSLCSERRGVLQIFLLLLNIDAG